jgi:hypothetical protein
LSNIINDNNSKEYDNSPKYMKSIQIINQFNIHTTTSTNVINSATILSILQQHWIFSNNTDIDLNFNTQCPFAKFRHIPEVNDLNGFSWQKNWDIASETSPCTQHLLTKIVNDVPVMGIGQYIEQYQELKSLSGNYILKLEKNGQLCLYKKSIVIINNNVNNLNELQRCITKDGIFDRQEYEAYYNSSAHSDIQSYYYASLLDGDLCFFYGNRPHFGGDKQSSGHRELAWCTSNINHTTTVEKYPITISNRVLSAEKPSINSIRNRVLNKVKNTDCTKRIIPSSHWESVYLHVANDGVIGLFVASSSISPFSIVSPKDRVAHLRVGRCF